MPWSCFKYPADAPAGTRRHEAVQAAGPDLRRMPIGSCFSNPADVPPGTTGRDPAPSVPPGLRRMPSMCFRY